MKKLVIVFITIPFILFGQDAAKKEQGAENQKKNSEPAVSIPALSQYSNNFKVSKMNFNRKIDVGGKGEILEVEMEFVNLLDEPQELLVFTIATFEKCERTNSSLEKPIPEKERLRTFIPYPNDIKNFEYPDSDKDGNVRKEASGKEKIKYVKYPKNPLAGVNPETGKPYLLKDRLVIRATHLSLYRNNYFFFNNVSVLIFDKEGKPLSRNHFELNGFRR